VVATLPHFWYPLSSAWIISRELRENQQIVQSSQRERHRLTDRRLQFDNKNS
jgi:hypothetical protein